jgi:hypothetical protein
MAGRPRGDVQDPARAASAQARQDQRGQVERRLDLDREHQRVPLGGEILDAREVGDRGVVDQDVGGPDGAHHLGEKPCAFLGLGQIRLNRDRPPASGNDLVAGLTERSLVLGIGVHRAGG